MRLKSVTISQYKNLKDFTLNFDGESFIDVFVGKNGTGKSNLFEALIEIFRHIVEYDREKEDLSFDYSLRYEIEGTETEIVWNAGGFRINGEERATIGETSLPDNVLIYYSGHNDRVAQLVQQYEETFRKRIKNADFSESRRFIGIGTEYKELLLAVLLMQPEANKARCFISQKLGIDKLGLQKPGTNDFTEPVVKLTLIRPGYARGIKFDVENNDENDRYWKPEGITKIFLDKLTNCVIKTPGGVTVNEGYFKTDDYYILYLDLGRIQKEFADVSAQDLFRQFDNLKTLGLLNEISIPLQLNSGVNASISHFSDGQFQSVYIYSIVELFKDRNCITLLDEPDSFLHPEWQFDFLKQVFEITDTAAKNNHVLMSSHSASTITAAHESVISLFEFDGNNVAVTKVKKADIISSLSAGLIAFSESEARLNIHHVLNNTSGGVLFTEGITDEMILETAWSKLYPEEKLSFEIQTAFSCGFLRNLMKDKTLYTGHPGRVFFSLFDFDEAHKDWNQLGVDVQTDPHQCLIKKQATRESYALLLPVPVDEPIRRQVINPHTGGNYGKNSLLTIELLFYGIDGLDEYFKVDTERTDGFIKFASDGQKITFARDVVPALDVEFFEIFRPMFEFIRSKCH